MRIEKSSAGNPGCRGVGKGEGRGGLCHSMSSCFAPTSKFKILPQTFACGYFARQAPRQKFYIPGIWAPLPKHTRKYIHVYSDVNQYSKTFQTSVCQSRAPLWIVQVLALGELQCASKTISPDAVMTLSSQGQGLRPLARLQYGQSQLHLSSLSISIEHICRRSRADSYVLKLPGR